MISASVESHGNKIMSETGRAENRCCNCELTYPLRTITVRVDSADPLLESAIEVRLVIILIPCRGDALPRGSDIGDKLTAPQRIHRVFVILALEVNVAVQIPGLGGYVVEESVGLSRGDFELAGAGGDCGGATPRVRPRIGNGEEQHVEAAVEYYQENGD